ncbi:uncharacterized protein PGTG_17628 [Puccinia graminis f. sp. tritici CRL 75-36-700-3]|uniref:Uncharacterized protein n=1 Tax=Puccinia graminis f. sp. tritici (strain CRL 75-36-700-3 / race SCCL) TaxID=418459 RepID=E3L4U9_PUCGT|nr:uncharacterized protein PGTG_17628 [Puccinia graminis f. sp. tritici CRL 75-36-700-3]EFP91574.1 hypothetical protein PGTG_17628 [Puccinia graminis f. sp. tritici CRL 75-36-700-3]
MLEENCSPVAPVTLEFPPQLLENSQNLDPLDKNQSVYLGLQSKICAGIIFSEEDLSVGKFIQTTVNPIPELQNSLTILVEEKNEGKFSQNTRTEDVSALDSVKSIQSPTINSTIFAPEGIGTPEEPIPNITPNLLPEIDSIPHSQLNSMETHVAEPCFKEAKDEFFYQQPAFIPSSQVFDSHRNLDKTLGPYNKETDPGKITEIIVKSAYITEIIPGYFSPTTHQVPPHQHGLKPFKPPDISQNCPGPPLVTLEKLGLRKPVEK